MVAVGLVLLVLAALLCVGVALPNTAPADVEAFGVSLSGVSVGGLFLVGVATGAVAALGLAMLVGGAARRRSKSVRTRKSVRSARSEAEMLADENARLREELGTSDASPYPTDSGSSRDDATAR